MGRGDCETNTIPEIYKKYSVESYAAFEEEG